MYLLSGYAKPVKALAVSRDGTRLFSAAKGQAQVWEWDLTDREVKQKLRGAHSAVETLAVSPDGKWLLAGEGHRGVTVWPLDGGEPFRFEETDGDYTSFDATVSVNASSTQVVTPWENWRDRRFGAMVWDLRTGKKVKPIPLPNTGRPHAAAFCPGTTLLAVADKQVRICDYESGTLRHVLEHSAVPQEIAFRPDGDVLATASGRSIFLWDVAKGVLVRTLTGQGGGTVLAYSPDGKYLASAGPSGIVVLHDARTYELLGQRHLDVGKIGALAWRRDSQTLFVGGAKPIAVCELDELFVKEGAKPKKRGEPLSLTGPSRTVADLSYSPDGRTLAGCDDLTVHLWDMSGGAGQAKQRVKFPRAGYWCGEGQITWSPDGSRVAVNPKIADARTGEAIRTDFPTGTRHVGYTTAGHVIIVQEEGARPRRIQRLSLHHGTTDALLCQTEVDEVSYTRMTHVQTFGEADDRIYALLNDRSISLWTPGTGVSTPIEQKTSIRTMAVRADERLLVTTATTYAFVWSLPEGKKLLELKHPLTCTGAEFAPNDRLITTSYDGLVRVWDLSGGAEMHAFDLGMGRVYSLAVSPDGMTFAAAVHKGNRIVLMDVPE
jgi:WD40 repeat protein